MRILDLAGVLVLSALPVCGQEFAAPHVVALVDATGKPVGPIGSESDEGLAVSFVADGALTVGTFRAEGPVIGTLQFESHNCSGTPYLYLDWPRSEFTIPPAVVSGPAWTVYVPARQPENVMLASEIGPSGTCVRHSGYHGTPAYPLTRTVDLLPLFQPPFRIAALVFEECYCPRRRLVRMGSSGSGDGDGPPRDGGLDGNDGYRVHTY